MKKLGGLSSVAHLTHKILKGNIAYLSRAITLVESNHKDHAHFASIVVERCLPFANNSLRIGITGVPGVGKSTFIETFGKYLRTKGKKLAVLAVDPSSSISKGSILGDKTRMQDLANDPGVFIRPSASGTSLGGVARSTRETIVLCEAAGFDVILIETVGVGQSETTVHSMVDFFLLLKLAGAGDELQGVKRGIMEMADAIAINKADGENLKRAQLAQTEFTNALHYFQTRPSEWHPKVTLCSAIEGTGVSEIWEQITAYVEMTKTNGYFESKRRKQNQYWMYQSIENQLKSRFYKEPKIIVALDEQLKMIENNLTTPFKAAEHLLGLIK